MVVTASLLVASVFGELNWSEGYCWVHSQLNRNHESLPNRTKIEQAVMHFKSKDLYSSINLLKGLKKKEAEGRDISATNMSFL